MRERGLGPLGKRLLVAFLLVAVASIGTLSAAAWIGTTKGIDASQRADRRAAAQAVAAETAKAYGSVGDWSRVDFTRPAAAAEAVAARLVIRDAAGRPVFALRAPGAMNGGQMGLGAASSDRWTTADVVVAGVLTGTVSLGYDSAVSGGADAIAWTWIIAAAVVALVAAFLLAWFVSRRIAQPLLRISSAAQRFAAGDRSARTDPRDANVGWELGELARSFDATANHVVRSELARQRISADVAHELRTPLAALQAGLEEIRDGLVPPDTARLTALHAQSVRLGRVVSDLAALSAAEAATLSMHLVPAQVDLVVAAAFREALPVLETAGVVPSLQTQPSLRARVDVDRLHQAIGNLLSNAARYCRAGDAVSVAVARQGASVVINVDDTGPGVSDAELPHLFERLWRGATASDVSGSGIGLAVVRELIHAQHGEVTAARNPSGGLSFRIVLPAEA